MLPFARLKPPVYFRSSLLLIVSNIHLKSNKNCQMNVAEQKAEYFPLKFSGAEV